MILRVDNVLKHYGEQAVLAGVSLEIEKGMVCALSGPSGAGKTTLVRIISGLLGFDAGRLIIGESEVRADEPYPAKLYGKIGVVFQDHNLFPHMTAIQNITLALSRVRGLSKGAAEARALAELERVGLSRKFESYPSALSGGERQRLAIARALAMDPLLLLLDEPTSGLDHSKIGEVLNIIAGLATSGTTMLLITHNICFAQKVGNRFAMLDGGKLCVSDTPDILGQTNGDWS